MPTLKEVFKDEEQREFLTRLGYKLEGDINQVHPITKTSPFHDLVDSGEKDVVKLLLKQEIDINKPDEHTHEHRKSRTPLLIAISNGDEDMANLLLDSGAKGNICDDTGTAPLMLATIMGNRGMLASLIDKGKVDIDQENTCAQNTEDQYKTAVMYAVTAGHLLNAQFLIQRRAKLNNSQGKTIFDYCSDDDVSQELKTCLNSLKISEAVKPKQETVVSKEPASFVEKLPGIPSQKGMYSNTRSQEPVGISGFTSNKYCTYADAVKSKLEVRR